MFNRNLARILSIILVMFSLRPVSTALGQSNEGATKKPGSIYDLVVVEEQNVARIYACDRSEGGIFVFVLRPDHSGPIKFSDFSLFFDTASVGLPAPAGLAYLNGKLIFCDSSAGGLYELDIATGKHTVLAGKDKVAEPQCLAVSDDGVIAVGDDDKNDILLYEKEKDFQPLGASIHDPKRIAFAGSSLYVFDEQTRSIYRVPVTGSRGERKAASQEQVSFPDEAKIGPGEITDFGYRKGIFHVSAKQRIVTIPGRELRVTPVYFPTHGKATYPRLAATENSLFAVDNEHSTVSVLDRPIPIKVTYSTIETDLQRSYYEQVAIHQTAQSALYTYLYNKNKSAFPKREYEAERAYESMQEVDDWLSTLPGFIPSPPDRNERRTASELQAKARAHAALKEMICRINEWPCESDKQVGGAAAAGGNSPSRQLIAKGKSVRLPDIPIVGGKATAVVNLQNMLVKDHIGIRVGGRPWENSINTEYLWRINERTEQSLNRYLSTERFIKANPPGTWLRPGVGIRIKQDQDEVITDASQCLAGGPIKIEDWPQRQREVLVSLNANEDLPRKIDDPNGRTSISELEGVKVEVSFRGPMTVERIDPDSLVRSLQPGTQGKDRACVQGLIDSGTRPVVVALKVSGAQYKLKSGGKPKTLKDQDLRRWGILGRGQQDERGEWSIVVDEPFYIGYRLLDTGSNDKESFRIIADPMAVNSPTSQNIFNTKGGAWVLPYTEWSQVVYVSAQDYQNKASELHTSVFSYPGVNQTRIQIGSVSDSSYYGPGDSNDECESRGTDELKKACRLERARKDREALIDAIKHINVRGEPVYVAVMELGEVDYNHKAFQTKKGDIWYTLEHGCLSPKSKNICSEKAPTIPAPEDNPPTSNSGANNDDAEAVDPPEDDVAFKDKPDPDDHATHVSSILGARPQSAAPGLLSSPQLILLRNSTIAANVIEDIKRAKGENVNIFSFSESISDDDTWQEAKDNMVAKPKAGQDGNWRELLFVVAAGNQKKNYTDKSHIQNVFVNWRPDVHNVIVVGATDFSGKIWEEPDGVEKGSNTGERHVHILAPGVDILGAARGPVYTWGTGTSQATPIVTAAAASIKSLSPPAAPTAIKARLIYTTDFDLDKHLWKVWGGLLNFQRAVWQLTKNYYVLKPAEGKPKPEKAYLLEITGNPKIKVLNEGFVYSHNGDQVARPPEISFAKILRIHQLSNGKKRVVYLEGDDNKLRILMNASLDEATLNIRSLVEVNIKTGESVKKNVRQIKLSQLYYDYVAGMPATVTY